MRIGKYLTIIFFLLIGNSCAVNEDRDLKIPFDLETGGIIVITGNAAKLINSELVKYYNPEKCFLKADTLVSFVPDSIDLVQPPPIMFGDSLYELNSKLPFGLIRYNPQKYSKPIVELGITIYYGKYENNGGFKLNDIDYLELVFALNMELTEVLSYGANSIGLPDTFPVKTEMFPGVEEDSR